MIITCHGQHILKGWSISYPIIFNLRQLRHILEIKPLKMLILFSLITYKLRNFPLWKFCSSRKSFSCSKKKLRLLCLAGYQDHCQTLFQKKTTMPLPCLFIYKSELEWHRNQAKLSKSSDIYYYSTRSVRHIITFSWRIIKFNKNT